MSASEHKILFLNPPNRLSIARRYMCAYYSPAFLLPPHDLIHLASCIRAWNGYPVVVLDAIAHRCSEEQVRAFIEREAITCVVALTGVETFGEDMACLTRAKDAFPDILFVVFGYYPTLYPEETLEQGKMDYVILGEPEKPLSQCLRALSNSENPSETPGLCGRRDDQTVFVNRGERIVDLDSLPLPDYSLVSIERYAEAFLGEPCGAILSSRGCSFGCTYCTTTYGRRLVLSSPERVIEEITHLKHTGIRFVRFLDDTFTTNRKRVIEICRLMVERSIDMPWACLSRIDTLDREILEWMAKAGCKRIMIGIESYSERMLDLLNKQINVDMVDSQLALVREFGIEVLGFFLVGGPLETRQDFETTLHRALKAPLDYITANPMTPYGGTPFFEQIRDEVEFSLFPYVCRYRDAAVSAETQRRKRLLYLRFYLRPAILIRHLRVVLRHPLLALRLLVALLR